MVLFAKQFRGDAALHALQQQGHSNLTREHVEIAFTNLDQYFPHFMVASSGYEAPILVLPQVHACIQCQIPFDDHLREMRANVYSFQEVHRDKHFALSVIAPNVDSTSSALAIHAWPPDRH